jgi:hypothetical protein
MHISLHFKRSETITMQVVAGPLGTPDTTSAPRCDAQARWSRRCDDTI